MSFVDAFDRSRRDADRIARETWDDWLSMILSLECERDWDCASRLLWPKPRLALIVAVYADGDLIRGGGE